MTQFLGIGMTHYPLLAGTDEHMAGLLRWTLTDPDIPEAEKDVPSWPGSMREDWSDDGGTAAATRHRKDLVANLARVLEALDEFEPDLVVVWGDDQYENFREEVIPPFCVLAYGDVETHPFELMNERGSKNAWGLPDDMTITLHGDSEAARQLADVLIADEFDMAYSYQKRDSAHFPHAILNTQLFLDYPNAGREMQYPLVPITVNCYGQHAVARRGGLARFAEIRDEPLSLPVRSRSAASTWAALSRGPTETAGSRSHWSHPRAGRTLSCMTRAGTCGRTRLRTRSCTTLWWSATSMPGPKSPARRSSTPASTRCSTGSASWRGGRAEPPTFLVDLRHHRHL